MNESLLENTEIENLSVFVVWSNQLGATASHVPEAAALMADPRASHFWDGTPWLDRRSRR